MRSYRVRPYPRSPGRLVVAWSEWHVLEVATPVRASSRRAGLRRAARALRPVLATAVAAGALSRALGSVRPARPALVRARRLELGP
ncbi:MAG: hypothetical protein M3N31_08405 [Actinomycetota bacterium]|nr:hypothetical protein [Actinomycetota bacterium]